MTESYWVFNADQLAQALADAELDDEFPDGLDTAAVRAFLLSDLLRRAKMRIDKEPAR